MNSNTLKHGNATIIIRRPELTPEEQTRAGDKVMDVVAATMRNYWKRKESKT